MNEFGKGCCYCLGLFLVHAHQDVQNNLVWINGASDHLFELQIPDHFPEELKLRLTNFRTKILEWRSLYFTQLVADVDRTWAITEAKALLFEIDKILQVDVDEAQWD